MNFDYTLNPDTQKLVNIEEQGDGHWLRIHCKDGEIFEGFSYCRTWTPFGDDEDADAMSFTLRDGSGYTVAGAEIDHFEVLEERDLHG